MTIYVVTTGTYSDYQIDAMFTNEYAAKQVVDMYNNAGHHIEARLEVYETDVVRVGLLYTVSLYPAGRFHTYMGAEGDMTIGEVVPSGANRERFPGAVTHTVVVDARDKQHAEKIAADLFAQYKAREAGI